MRLQETELVDYWLDVLQLGEVVKAVSRPNLLRCCCGQLDAIENYL